jgi:YbbR domain-containing protein
VTVNQPISQRGGYRVVAVRVVVAGQGQVASGYRLTSLTAFPSTVTVFSSNPALIERLPGYVETSPLDLTGAQENIEVRLPLNLPDGVEVDGDQNVLVQASVAPIEGSITLSGLPVQVVGLPDDFVARISPRSVDVIVSGPLPVLDRLTESDVRVFLELSQVEAGTYQLAPRVTLNLPQLRMEALLPASIEVVVELESEVTPTVTPSPTATPRPGVTVTATPTR